MPILKDFREKQEIVLPITKGKISLYSYILAKDSIEIDKIYVSDTDVSLTQEGKQSSPISLRASKYYEAMDASLVAMIADWDFTDEEGKPIEPTPENIKKLPKEDFDYLRKEIDKRIASGRLEADEKKD